MRAATGKILLRFFISLRSPSLHYGKNKPKNKISSTRFCPWFLPVLISYFILSFYYLILAILVTLLFFYHQGHSHLRASDRVFIPSLWNALPPPLFTTLHPSLPPALHRQRFLPGLLWKTAEMAALSVFTAHCNVTCSSSIKRSGLFLYLINLGLPCYLL